MSLSLLLNSPVLLLLLCVVPKPCLYLLPTFAKIPQHARALEAFARLMPQAPEQLVPLISTSFECMAAIPLEQNGQLPPPAKVTWRWKEEAMARISMAKVRKYF